MVQLESLFTDLVQQPDLSTVAFLHVYCDVLSVNTDPSNGIQIIDITPLRTPLKYIHIFSRKLSLKSDSTEICVVVKESGPPFRLICDTLAGNVKFSYALTSAKEKRYSCELYSGTFICPDQVAGKCSNGHFSFGLGNAGVILSLAKDKDKLSVETLLSVPNNEITVPTVGVAEFDNNATKMRYVRSISGLSQKSWCLIFLSQLPKFLQWEFKLACRDLLTKQPDLDVIMSRLRYVVRCTKFSSDMHSFGADAQELLERLSGPYNYSGLLGSKSPDRIFFAPHFRVDFYIEELNGAISNAKSLRDKLNELDSQKSNNEKVAGLFAQVVTQLKKTIYGFGDINSARNDAEEAIKDLQEKTKELGELNMKTMAAKTAYEQEVRDTYKEKVSHLKREIFSKFVSCTDNI
jgi:prefoldin subunit 5